MSMRARFGLLAAVLALAAPAQAEIFKCVGPNGDVRFTSDASQCPNAAPHAPKPGALQRVEKGPPPLASARPGAPTSARRLSPASHDMSAAAEATWRQKKEEAERNVRTLEAQHERVLAAVRWCNKGHGVTTEDPRTGIRTPISCSQIDAERAQIEGDLERAHVYLETGLEEECRAAGCLPGWLR
jgi:hypothetical protein